MLRNMVLELTENNKSLKQENEEFRDRMSQLEGEIQIIETKAKQKLEIYKIKTHELEYVL